MFIFLFKADTEVSKACFISNNLFIDVINYLIYTLIISMLKITFDKVVRYFQIMYNYNYI